MRRALALLLVAACGHAAPAPRASDPVERAADEVGHEAVAAGVVGMAIVVLRHGEPVVAKGYGFADLEHREPMTPEHVFITASITKQFWSQAALQLVEKKRLRLDAPVQDVLPAFPDRRVTLAHVMSHTAGLGDDAEHEDDARFSDLPPLLFAPGTSWHYSNRGSLITRTIVEHVSGQAWADYLREHIATPLGLAHTNVCPATGGHTPGFALERGHAVAADESEELMTRVRFVCSTPLDVARWERGFDRGAVLAPASLAALRTPAALGGTPVLPYGLFTRIGDLQGHRAYGHTGSLRGVNGAAFHFPDDDLTIVVFQNVGDGAPVHAHKIVARLARAALGLTMPPVRDLPVPADVAAAISGEYVLPGLRLRVAMQDGALWGEVLEPPGGPRARIYYQGGSAFLGDPAHVDGDTIIGFDRVTGSARWMWWGHRLMLADVAARAP